MDAKEFIETFQKSGYGSKKSAETYVENHKKNNYTIDNIIELYHSYEEVRCTVHGVKGLRSIYGINGKTTAMSNGIAGNSGNRKDWEE